MGVVLLRVVASLVALLIGLLLAMHAHADMADWPRTIGIFVAFAFLAGVIKPPQPDIDNALAHLPKPD